MKKIKYFLSILICLVMVALPTGLTYAIQQPSASGISKVANFPAQTTQEYPLTCHFGIDVVQPFTSYDLSTLGVGSYLDWGRYRNSSVPANIEYFRVLQVMDLHYSKLKGLLSGLLANDPGATWIIGNEPDSEVSYQDHISAETYAERFFELATIIRQDDPKAKIGFGSIIQPTPVRIYYLTLAMNKLVDLAGGAVQAHALIDFYPIHAYILNEGELYDANGKSISWGAGVPVGYDAATWPAPETIHPEWGETYKTYDINIFKGRLIAFRQWMAAQGEQDKPLWITEYGSLFPAEGNPYLYVSEKDSADYMVQTYDFMLGYKDPGIGYAADDYRLVQKWFWYSLNGPTTAFGGSLYNPLTQRLTEVGQRFFQYDPSLTAVPITDPDVYIVPGSLVLTPISESILPGRVNYKATVKVANNISSDRQVPGQVNLYDGATLVGSFQAMLPRCSGTEQVSFPLKNLAPGEIHNFKASISVLANNGTDLNLSNNELTFNSVTVPVPTTYSQIPVYLPMVKR